MCVSPVSGSFLLVLSRCDAQAKLLWNSSRTWFLWKPLSCAHQSFRTGSAAHHEAPLAVVIGSNVAQDVFFVTCRTVSLSLRWHVKSSSQSVISSSESS